MNNETQLANELRGTLAEGLVVSVSDDGGHAQRDRLVAFANGDEWATSEAVQVLEDLGLARISSMAFDVEMTPAGQRVAQQIRVLRSGQWRIEDLNRAALTWLNRQGEHLAADLDGFLDAPEAADFEPPVTIQELRDAIEVLGEADYVMPIPVAELGPVKAMITPKGRVALRSGLPIGQQGGSNHTTYDNRSAVTFGDGAQVGGFQSGGQGNVQVVEQLIGPDERSKLAAQVASLVQMAEELPDDTPGVEEGRKDLDVISQELAKPAVKRGALKSLAYKALGTFAVAAGTSGGQQIVHGLGHLLKLLEKAAGS